MFRNSNRTYDDLQLAVAIKQGNQQSFGLLYDKYAPALLGIIIRIANNQRKAEEILSHVFVKVWNQIASFNSSNTSLFSWLIQLTRQTAFDEIKAEQTKNSADNNSVYKAAKNASGSNLPLSRKNSLSSFELIYYKGLNFTEAASALQITVTELTNNLKMEIETLKEKEII